MPSQSSGGYKTSGGYGGGMPMSGGGMPMSGGGMNPMGMNPMGLQPNPMQMNPGMGGAMPGMFATGGYGM